MLVQTSAFEELCNNQNCHEAWRLYQEYLSKGTLGLHCKLGKLVFRDLWTDPPPHDQLSNLMEFTSKGLTSSKCSGWEVSTEDQHRLLDLFCYSGYKNEKSFTTMQIDTFSPGDSDFDNYRTHYMPRQGKEYSIDKSIWL